MSQYQGHRADVLA